MNDFIVTNARSEAISFAHPVGQVYFSLYIQNPSGALNYMAYIEPMTNMTWLCVGLFCILSPLILFLTNQYVSILVEFSYFSSKFLSPNLLLKVWRKGFHKLWVYMWEISSVCAQFIDNERVEWHSNHYSCKNCIHYVINYI